MLGVSTRVGCPSSIHQVASMEKRPIESDIEDFVPTKRHFKICGGGSSTFSLLPVAIARLFYHLHLQSISVAALLATTLIILKS